MKNLKQTDGKDYERVKPKTLDEIWGFKLAKFPTHDEAVYRKVLDNMNKADMQAEAIRVGLMPHDNRNIMTDRLITQFRQHVAALDVSQMKRKVLKVSPRGRNILAQGGNNLV